MQIGPGSDEAAVAEGFGIGAEGRSGLLAGPWDSYLVELAALPAWLFSPWKRARPQSPSLHTY